MKLTSLRFEYPITRPFSKPYCLFLLAFGLLSASVLTTIDVFLVDAHSWPFFFFVLSLKSRAGYDVVSITTIDFNTPRGLRLPWERNATVCEQHQFQLGDSFPTNISAFSYSIFDVQPDVNATDAVVVQGGFSYGNNDLSLCDVTQYEITVRPGDRLITASVSIQCPPRISFQVVTSWNYSNYAMVGTIPALMFPENSLARAITDEEVYWDIYNSLYITNDNESLSQKVYKVVTPDVTRLLLASSLLSISTTQSGTVILISLAGKMGLPASRLTRIFTNTTSFNHTMLPTDWVAPENTAYRDLASSKGMAYVNLTTPPSPNE
ncbi:hypothetical protein B0H13DRAFT_2265461 [Mycena leptocephala]|nr:hypothetical protein B0H13DRAFT_2265461 [Mycena leptocephala]